MSLQNHCQGPVDTVFGEWAGKDGKIFDLKLVVPKRYHRHIDGLFDEILFHSRKISVNYEEPKKAFGYVCCQFVYAPEDAFNVACILMNMGLIRQEQYEAIRNSFRPRTLN